MFVDRRIRLKRADWVHADNCAESREDSSVLEQSAHRVRSSIRARHNLEATRFELLQRCWNVRKCRQPQILFQQTAQGFFLQRNIELPGNKSQRLLGAYVEILI